MNITLVLDESSAELVKRALLNNPCSGPSEAYDCEVLAKMIVAKLDEEGEKRIDNG